MFFVYLFCHDWAMRTKAAIRCCSFLPRLSYLSLPQYLVTGYQDEILSPMTLRRLIPLMMVLFPPRIQNRRSIFPKQYSPSMPVPRYILEKMLEVARWSPSHHLTQPWYFTVFETE
mmetsp:Transcript_17402/g.24796  ORF Transcript_17402/g.24796 Transcript_17402/m.24796 type:complete len:116 (+) Transcript_17402:120-467(+)